jgi:hypothetical protein
MNMRGANLLAIQTAVQKAQNIFSLYPDTSVVLYFPAGTYDFSQDTSVNPSVYCTPSMVTLTQDNCPATQAIDLSNVHPGKLGRLILMGDGPALTTFITNPDQAGFYGKHVNRVSIVGIHQTLDRLTASQGHVVNPIGNSYPSNVVVVDVDPGFPTLDLYPLGLYNPGKSGNQAHYLRQFISDGSVCHIDWQSPTPRQSFDTVTYMPEAGHPLRYWLTLNVHSGPTNPFADGALVGIKLEAGQGNTYLFQLGGDIIFADMLWTNRSRGAFESLSQVGGMTNAQIYDSSIRKNSPIGGNPVCIAGSGGGPQIGQPNDMPVWENVIDNFYSESTGDDTIATFNAYYPNTFAPGTTISNSFITDSFGRSINLYQTIYPFPPNDIPNPTPDPSNVINTVRQYCDPSPTATQYECLLINTSGSD